MTFEPLRVTARLWGRVILPPQGIVHLDAMLAWAVCQLEMRPPALDETMLAPVEIPVQRSECGRYHLCSTSVSQPTRVPMKRSDRLRHIHKRFPEERWQTLGGGKSANRIQLSAGPSKSWREPVETTYLDDNLLSWWCIGGHAEIARLLDVVTHVGRRRAVGEGEVREWHVEPCESWGEGFPTLGPNGEAMRPLPLDTPGLGEHVPRIGTLSYPYWLRSAEGPIAAPPVQR